MNRVSANVSGVAAIAASALRVIPRIDDRRSGDRHVDRRDNHLSTANRNGATAVTHVGELDVVQEHAFQFAIASEFVGRIQVAAEIDAAPIARSRRGRETRHVAAANRIVVGTGEENGAGNDPIALNRGPASRWRSQSSECPGLAGPNR